MPRISTRAQTRLTGRFIRDTAGSSALLRGLRILRAFRLEKPFLTNGELAKITGIPRPTVSRLTTSLVQAGFLNYVASEGTYRLDSVVLSLGMVYASHSHKLRIARPLMDSTARRWQINVGLAVRDQHEMVYLDSLRFSRSYRNRPVSPGTRVPLETTSLGRAFLYGMPEAEREELLRELAKPRRSSWSKIRQELDAAFRHMDRNGWCAASFQPGILSIATPLVAEDGSLLSINISFPWEQDLTAKIPARYPEILIDLARRVKTTWRQELR